MQFLTSKECDEWLTRVGRTAPTRQSLLSLETAKRSNIEREPPARLYHTLQAAIQTLHVNFNDPIFLQVFEYGIWPSNEKLLLYSLLRRHFLNTGIVEDTPGHLAEAHEQAFLHATAFLCATHGWGFFVLTPTGQDALMLDHDGNLGVVPAPSIRPF